MGLGSISEVSLKEVRQSADQWRTMVRSNKDPIKERERQRREAARNIYLLKDIAADAFESRKAELKGEGKAGRWFTPLELHILPKLGKMPVAEIDQKDIRDTLAPIWHTKAETARKAMNRLRICLQHGAALGLEVDLQAPDKARALLGRQRHKPGNIPALPWSEVPAFYATLTDGSVTHLALRLLILAQAILIQARRHARDGFIFPSVRKGVLSDMTMSRLMERAAVAARPHGFRSSLRDWIAETTDTPHEIAETVLGHTVGGSVERAYRRTDFLEQRRKLMEQWAQHVNGQTGISK